jgi:hypothetical protein
MEVIRTRSGTTILLSVARGLGARVGSIGGVYIGYNYNGDTIEEVNTLLTGDLVLPRKNRSTGSKVLSLVSVLLESL